RPSSSGDVASRGRTRRKELIGAGSTGSATDSSSSRTSTVSQDRSNVRLRLSTTNRWRYAPSSSTNRRVHDLGWNNRPGAGATTWCTAPSTKVSTERYDAGTLIPPAWQKTVVSSL